jgi:hypothetical protein
MALKVCLFKAGPDQVTLPTGGSKTKNATPGYVSVLRSNDKQGVHRQKPNYEF